MFIAEFGYYYGWNGVEAILNNRIDLPTAQMLLRGAIKVWYGKLVQQASVTRTAVAAARYPKKGKKIMQEGLKPFLKETK